MKNLLLLILIFGFTSGSFAQLNAEFSINKTEVCSPELTSFTDESSGNPDTWLWEFSNGTSSNAQNPNIVFSQPGIISVTLTITKDGEQSTITKNNLIRVFSSPKANFTQNESEGCVPLNVEFTDLSVPQSAAITDWFWSFGNGETSNEQFPNVTYNSVKSHTVFLRVTDQNGCQGSIERNKFITVGGPKADFTFDSLACGIPANVGFVNKSTGNNLTYSWDFGDGTNSTDEVPGAHTYENFDSTEVRLAVKETNTGCEDTLIKSMNIVNYQAEFNFNVSSCNKNSFTVNVHNTTEPNPSSILWDFGNGNTASTSQSQFTYNNVDAQKILLRADLSNNCWDTTSITYRPPRADFDYTSEECNPPMIISFQNTSIGKNLSYSWDFGDTTFSEVTNPVKQYETPPVVYEVILSVVDEFNCKDTRGKEVNAPFPIADFEVLDEKSSGCAPLEVSFIDTTSILLDSTEIIGVYWNFGDESSGPLNTSTELNPTHTFNDTGEYTITYAIFLDNGCVDTLISENRIKAGEKPDSIAIQTTLGDTICFGDRVGHISSAFIGNNLLETNYHCWLFETDSSEKLIDSETPPENCPIPQLGFNSQFNFVNFPSPNHDYINYDYESQDTVNGNIFLGNAQPSAGDLYTHLVTGYNGCYSSQKIPQYVKNTMAMPGFVLTYDSVNLFLPDTSFEIGIFNNSTNYDSVEVFRIVNDTTGAEVFTLNEEDTTFVKFNQPGTYTLELGVSNSVNNCSHLTKRTIVVENPNLELIFDDNLCIQDSTIDVFNGSVFQFANLRNRVWIVNDSTKAIVTDGGVSRDSITLFLPDTGWQYFSLDLFVKQQDNIFGTNFPDANYTYTIKDSIYVHGSKSFAEIDTNLVCKSNPIFISHTTNSTASIDSIIWDYQIDSTRSDLNNHAFTYNIPGNYTIEYTVYNSFGCSDKFKTPSFEVSGPIMGFSVNDTLACVGQEVSFDNQSSGKSLNFIWTTENQQYFNIDALHQYSVADTFDVKLVAQDVYGCLDSITKSNFMQIAPVPQADFNFSFEGGNCPPLIVTFSDTSQPETNQWEWNFGDEDISTDQNPVHTYTAPGLYDVSLSVSNYAGCSNTINKEDAIVIGGPRGNYNVNLSNICLPDTVVFMGDFQNTEYYVWDFDNGIVQNFEQENDGDTVKYIYKRGGVFTPILQLIDSNNCQFTLPPDLDLNIDSVAAQFELGDDTFCNLKPISAINNSRYFFEPEFRWTFGNGDTLIEESPNINFLNEGSYNVKLNLITENGCKDSSIVNIQVFKEPEFELAINSEDFCIPSQTGFKLNILDSIFIADKTQLFIDNQSYNDTALINITEAKIINTRGLIEYANNECLVDTFIELEYFNQPTVDFTFDPEFNSTSSSEIQFTAITTSANTYFWEFDNGEVSSQKNPTRFFGTEGEYNIKLIASNEGNCIDSIVKKVAISPFDFIKIPNAFSPDGDGIDETFGVVYAGNVEVISFKVFNQWGNLLFEGNEINEKWDGKVSNRIQPNGSYIYHLLGKDSEGRDVELKGNFVLIR